MVRALNPKNWDVVPSQIQLETHCKIQTPIRRAKRAFLTRVLRTAMGIEFYGKPEGAKSEEMLGKINTQKSTGTMRTTCADGVVLLWEEDGVKGKLLTFP